MYLYRKHEGAKLSIETDLQEGPEIKRGRGPCLGTLDPLSERQNEEGVPIGPWGNEVS